MIFSCAVGFSKNIFKIPDLSLPPCTVPVPVQYTYSELGPYERDLNLLCLFNRVSDRQWLKANPDPAFSLIADSDPVPDSGIWWPKTEKILQLKKLSIYWSKFAIYLSLGLQDAQATGKPSALKREHPALQKMKFLFSNFVGHFFPLRSGSTNSNYCGSSGSETCSLILPVSFRVPGT